jgi:hypothetical protein
MNIRNCSPIDTFFSRKEGLKEGKFVPAHTNKLPGISAENITAYILRSNEYRSFMQLCKRRTTEFGHLPPAVLFAMMPAAGPSLLSN